MAFEVPQNEDEQITPHVLAEGEVLPGAEVIVRPLTDEEIDDFIELTNSLRFFDQRIQR